MMDSDFFGGQTDLGYVNQDYGQNQFQPQYNTQAEDFQFSEPINYSSMSGVQQPNLTNYSPDNEALIKMQEEQMRILEQLRQKSNKEYEEKQRRRQEGQRQYQEFLEKKQRQTAARKQQNIEKEKQLLAVNQRLSQQAGWKKVAANVPLKQGQHKGKKDTTRMRESIINKKNDELN